MRCFEILRKSKFVGGIPVGEGLPYRVDVPLFSAGGTCGRLSFVWCCIKNGRPKVALTGVYASCGAYVISKNACLQEHFYAMHQLRRRTAVRIGQTPKGLHSKTFCAYYTTKTQWFQPFCYLIFKKNKCLYGRAFLSVTNASRLVTP